MTATERLTLRQLESRPVWDRLLHLIQSDAAKGVLPKDKMNEALTYIRNQ